VLGDALAIALLKKKDFSREEFAFLHPGGIIGRKMLLRVNELMIRNSGIPKVKENTLFKDLFLKFRQNALAAPAL
jgi:arabinose-5-phosphate isomerase